MLCSAAQSVFAPASNLVFLTWMHLLGGGTLAALMPYIVVSSDLPNLEYPACVAMDNCPCGCYICKSRSGLR